MDKEIIIDGVNVAGCVQLVEEPFYPCGLGGECKGWENCYYKQLKRLEQENAELQAYKDVNEDFKTAWEELKAENEKLDQENQELFNDKLKLDDLVKELKAENARLKEESERLSSWLASSEKQRKEVCNVIHKKKEQIQTLKYMLFDEKEIPKDKFTMYYRVAQNERRTKSHRDLCTNVVKKYRQTLQEIKAIAEELLEKGLEPQSVEHQLRLKGKRELASIISDLITKAESEEV